MNSTLTMSNYIFNTNTDVYSKLVYAAIKKHSNNEGKCFPSRNTLAQLCKISLSTLRKAINNLNDANILDKKYRYRENRSQTSNLYTLAPFMISGDYYFKVRADIFDLDLTICETVVYMYLCSCSNKDNECYPSMRQIAEACGIGQTSAKSAIKGLIQKCMISKSNQFRDDGGKRNNLYKIVSADQNEESEEGAIEPRPTFEMGVNEAHGRDSKQKEIISAPDINDNEGYELIEITSKSGENGFSNDVHVAKAKRNKDKANIRGDIFDFKLSKKSFMTYMYMNTYAQLNKGNYPSYKQIAKKCKISRSKVLKVILELKKYGLINKLMRDKGNNDMVVLEPPPWAI